MTKGGPKTESGKAVARLNATRHGVRATLPVVPGIERAGDWNAHRAATLASLSPEGHLEHLLAERVALQFWRLHRVARYEAGIIVNAQEAVQDDVAEARRNARIYSSSYGDEITIDHPQEGATEVRSQAELVHRLELMPEMGDRDPVSGSEAEAVLYAVAARAKRVDMDEFPLPGVPQDANLSELEDWTTGKIRNCIAAIAAAERTDPEQLLTSTLASARLALDKLGREIEAINAQIERKRNERMLPPEKIMEKVARYEAHLSRELYRALHELEAMQARRQGQAAPLTRVEVHGLPET